MRVVIQRSGDSSVFVDGSVVSSIQHGLVLLIGFTEGDSGKELEWMARKIVNMRIFPDDNGVMNRSLLDVQGSVLAISQFTLYADCKTGNRPSYMKALGHQEAEVLYQEFCLELAKYTNVERGVFGADMEVSISNIGPTTIILER